MSDAFTLHSTMQRDRLLRLRRMWARIDGVLKAPRLSNEAIETLSKLTTDFNLEVAAWTSERVKAEERGW